MLKYAASKVVYIMSHLLYTSFFILNIFFYYIYNSSRVTEGNTSYILGAAHLLNVEKLQLFARCFSQIDIMQAQSYNLYPVKFLQVCLLSEFRQGQYFSLSHAAQWSRDMYDKSLLIDGIGIKSEANSETIDLPHIRNIEEQRCGVTSVAGCDERSSLL